MAYKVIILYRLYMPSYFLGTFTEYPYLNNFKETLVYMWKHNPNTNGLFGNDVFVHDIDKQKESKWLLTQAALIEMYARLSVFE